MTGLAVGLMVLAVAAIGVSVERVRLWREWAAEYRARLVDAQEDRDVWQLRATDLGYQPPPDRTP